MNTESHCCDHIAILTNNADRLVEFYVNILGFKKEREEILPRSITEQIFDLTQECRFIRLVSDNVNLEIFEPHSYAKEKGCKMGYNHWGYCVGDVEEFSNHLKSRGVELIEIDRKGHTVYFLKDSDGNLIELRRDRR